MADEDNLDFFDISNFWLNFASGTRSWQVYADFPLVVSGMPLTGHYIQISYFEGEDDLSTNRQIQWWTAWIARSGYSPLK